MAPQHALSKMAATRLLSTSQTCLILIRQRLYATLPHAISPRTWTGQQRKKWSTSPEKGTADELGVRADLRKIAPLVSAAYNQTEAARVAARVEAARVEVTRLQATEIKSSESEKRATTDEPTVRADLPQLLPLVDAARVKASRLQATSSKGLESTKALEYQKAVRKFKKARSAVAPFIDSRTHLAYRYMEHKHEVAKEIGRPLDLGLLPYKTGLQRMSKDIRESLFKLDTALGPQQFHLKGALRHYIWMLTFSMRDIGISLDVLQNIWSLSKKLHSPESLYFLPKLSFESSRTLGVIIAQLDETERSWPQSLVLKALRGMIAPKKSMPTPAIGILKKLTFLSNDHLKRLRTGLSHDPEGYVLKRERSFRTAPFEDHLHALKTLEFKTRDLWDSRPSRLPLPYFWKRLAVHRVELEIHRQGFQLWLIEYKSIVDAELSRYQVILDETGDLSLIKPYLRHLRNPAPAPALTSQDFLDAIAVLEKLMRFLAKVRVNLTIHLEERPGPVPKQDDIRTSLIRRY